MASKWQAARRCPAATRSNSPIVSFFGSRSRSRTQLSTRRPNSVLLVGRLRMKRRLRCRWSRFPRIGHRRSPCPMLRSRRRRPSRLRLRPLLGSHRPPRRLHPLEWRRALILLTRNRRESKRSSNRPNIMSARFPRMDRHRIRARSTSRSSVQDRRESRRACAPRSVAFVIISTSGRCSPTRS
jgi:hypothetical protein